MTDYHIIYITGKGQIYGLPLETMKLKTKVYYTTQHMDFEIHLFHLLDSNVHHSIMIENLQISSLKSTKKNILYISSNFKFSLQA